MPLEKVDLEFGYETQLCTINFGRQKSRQEQGPQPQLFYPRSFILNLYFSCASGAKNIIRMLMYFSNSTKKNEACLKVHLSHTDEDMYCYLFEF